MGARDDRRRKAGSGGRQQALSAGRARRGRRQGAAVLERCDLSPTGNARARCWPRSRPRPRRAASRRSRRGCWRRCSIPARCCAPARTTTTTWPRWAFPASRRKRSGCSSSSSRRATRWSGPGATVVMPRGTKKYDWEIELAAVIGKTARYVSVENALEPCRRLHGRDRSVGARFQSGAGSVLQVRLGRRKGDRHRLPDGAVDRAGRRARRPQNVALKLSVNGVVKQDSQHAAR